MQAQVKSIKGITVLELLIVLMIIGVISSVAYPNFRDWRTTRQVQDDIQRAKQMGIKDFNKKYEILSNLHLKK